MREDLKLLFACVDLALIFTGNLSMTGFDERRFALRMGHGLLHTACRSLLLKRRVYPSWRFCIASYQSWFCWFNASLGEGESCGISGYLLLGSRGSRGVMKATDGDNDDNDDDDCDEC